MKAMITCKTKPYTLPIVFPLSNMGQKSNLLIALKEAYPLTLSRDVTKLLLGYQWATEARTPYTHTSCPTLLLRHCAGFGSDTNSHTMACVCVCVSLHLSERLCKGSAHVGKQEGAWKQLTQISYRTARTSSIYTCGFSE